MRKRIYPRLFSLTGFVSGLAFLLIFTNNPSSRKMSSYTLLCLGDSYMIGEMVSPSLNFPNQTVELLRKSNPGFEDPEIVARTGWTTDELQSAINMHSFKDSYDFVTLLIGVNNQYRGRSVEEYAPQFESLLQQAIRFAHGKTKHVIVISIPDWGITPFALNNGRDK
ncbi:MAG TPA: GDSL-type esterase/lipase family protein, partial [Chitinophagaceae bacterium]